jgi:beta-xylosidase
MPRFILSFSACSGSNSNSEPYVDEYGVTHAKHRLFDYACPTATTCTQTANTYIAQVDGLFIELDLDFVEQCLEDKNMGKKVNRYCQYMISPGDTSSFKASAAVIRHILKQGPNPEESDHLTRRIEAAKLKIYN